MSAPKKIGMFPGQFDPITNGHLDVIRRGTVIFDELIVGVGTNPDKREMFTLDERAEMIGQLLKHIPGTRVGKYTGLTADFAREVKATAILRGIRDVSDLRYEFQLALANRAVGGVETVFIMTGDQYALTSSSLIRQVVSLGGDLDQLSAVLPANVIDRIREKKAGQGFGRPEPDAAGDLMISPWQIVEISRKLLTKHAYTLILAIIGQRGAGLRYKAILPRQYLKVKEIRRRRSPAGMFVAAAFPAQ